MTRQLARLTIVVVAVLLIAGVIDVVLAQGSPFGVPKGAPKGAPPDGFFAWIIAKQNEFYRQFSGLIRAAKADGSAVWGLLGVSFLYGVFHAAGPGHGKAVISSYVVANEETWKRGIALSFASAMLQALVAVAVVGIAAGLLRASAPTMKSAVDVIEIIAYAFIITIGVRLLRVKGIGLASAWRGHDVSPTIRAVAGLIEVLAYIAVIQFVAPSLIAVANPSPGFGNIAYQLVGAACLVLLWLRGSELVAVWRARQRTASEVGAAVTPSDHARHSHAHHAHEHGDHAHHDHAHHDHAHHDHAHHDHDRHDHGDHHHHDDASAWGHAHAPEPQELAGPGGWKRGLSAIVAVGLRPCSGAIIVLVFALAQGLFWAGVAATFVMGIGTAITVAVIATVAVGARGFAARLAGSRSGYGMVAMRGIEVAAAFVIIAFGSLLLTGYLVSERIGV